MKNAIVLLASLLVLELAGCVVAPPARRVAVVEVDVRPPPLRVVVAPAPRRGYVWAAGYWRWDGRRYDWIDGRWVRERRLTVRLAIPARATASASHTRDLLYITQA